MRQPRTSRTHPPLSREPTRRRNQLIESLGAGFDLAKLQAQIPLRQQQTGVAVGNVPLQRLLPRSSDAK